MSSDFPSVSLNSGGLNVNQATLSTGAPENRTVPPLQTNLPQLHIDHQFDLQSVLLTEEYDPAKNLPVTKPMEMIVKGDYAAATKAINESERLVGGRAALFQVIQNEFDQLNGEVTTAIQTFIADGGRCPAETLQRWTDRQAQLAGLLNAAEAKCPRGDEAAARAEARRSGEALPALLKMHEACTTAGMNVVDSVATRLSGDKEGAAATALLHTLADFWTYADKADEDLASALFTHLAGKYQQALTGRFTEALGKIEAMLTKLSVQLDSGSGDRFKNEALRSTIDRQLHALEDELKTATANLRRASDGQTGAVLTEKEKKLADLATVGLDALRDIESMLGFKTGDYAILKREMQLAEDGSIGRTSGRTMPEFERRLALVSEHPVDPGQIGPEMPHADRTMLADQLEAFTGPKQQAELADTLVRLREENGALNKNEWTAVRLAFNRVPTPTSAAHLTEKMRGISENSRQSLETQLAGLIKADWNVNTDRAALYNLGGRLDNLKELARTVLRSADYTDFAKQVDTARDGALPSYLASFSGSERHNVVLQSIPFGIPEDQRSQAVNESATKFLSALWGDVRALDTLSSAFARMDPDAFWNAVATGGQTARNMVDRVFLDKPHLADTALALKLTLFTPDGDRDQVEAEHGYQLGRRQLAGHLEMRITDKLTDNRLTLSLSRTLSPRSLRSDEHRHPFDILVLRTCYQRFRSETLRHPGGADADLSFNAFLANAKARIEGPEFREFLADYATRNGIRNPERYFQWGEQTAEFYRQPWIQAQMDGVAESSLTLDEQFEDMAQLGSGMIGRGEFRRTLQTVARDPQQLQAESIKKKLYARLTPGFHSTREAGFEDLQAMFQSGAVKNLSPERQEEIDRREGLAEGVEQRSHTPATQTDPLVAKRQAGLRAMNAGLPPGERFLDSDGAIHFRRMNSARLAGSLAVLSQVMDGVTGVNLEERKAALSNIKFQRVLDFVGFRSATVQNFHGCHINGHKELQEEFTAILDSMKKAATLEAFQAAAQKMRVFYRDNGLEDKIDAALFVEATRLRLAGKETTALFSNRVTGKFDSAHLLAAASEKRLPEELTTTGAAVTRTGLIKSKLLLDGDRQRRALEESAKTIRSSLPFHYRHAMDRVSRLAVVETYSAIGAGRTFADIADSARRQGGAEREHCLARIMDLSHCSRGVAEVFLDNELRKMGMSPGLAWLDRDTGTSLATDVSNLCQKLNPFSKMKNSEVERTCARLVSNLPPGSTMNMMSRRGVNMGAGAPVPPVIVSVGIQAARLYGMTLEHQQGGDMVLTLKKGFSLGLDATIMSLARTIGVSAKVKVDHLGGLVLTFSPSEERTAGKKAEDFLVALFTRNDAAIRREDVGSIGALSTNSIEGSLSAFVVPFGGALSTSSKIREDNSVEKKLAFIPLEVLNTQGSISGSIESTTVVTGDRVTRTRTGTVTFRMNFSTGLSLSQTKEGFIDTNPYYRTDYLTVDGTPLGLPDVKQSVNQFSKNQVGTDFLFRKNFEVSCITQSETVEVAGEVRERARIDTVTFDPGKYTSTEARLVLEKSKFNQPELIEDVVALMKSGVAVTIRGRREVDEHGGDRLTTLTLEYDRARAMESHNVNLSAVTRDIIPHIASVRGGYQATTVAKRTQTIEYRVA